MENSDDPGASPKPATQALAELVARRKAAGNLPPHLSAQGRRQSERAAAAHSASKSKPAMRKP